MGAIGSDTARAGRRLSGGKGSARSSGLRLQVLDRMLRLGEESRAGADSGDELEAWKKQMKPLIALHHPARPRLL